MMGVLRNLALVPLVAALIHSTPATASQPRIDWVAQFPSTIEGFSLGPAGSVMVLTHVYGQTSLGRHPILDVDEHLVRHLDHAGQLVATHDLDLPQQAVINGLAALPSGEFWIVGNEEQWAYYAWEPERHTPFIAGYDANGEKRFHARTPEEVDLPIYLRNRLQVDRSGNATWLFHGANGDPSGSKHFAIRRYDVLGNVLGHERLDLSANEFVTALDLDPTGAFSLAGFAIVEDEITTSSDFDGLVLRIDPLGNLLERTQFGSPSRDIANASTRDSGGNLWIGGQTGGDLGGPQAGSGDSFLRKIAPDGTTLFTIQFGTRWNNRINDIAVDSSDNLWAVGGSVESLETGGDAFIRQYDPHGNLLFSKVFATAEYEDFRSLLIDPWDNVFVAGRSTQSLGGSIFGGVDSVLLKFSATVPEPSTVAATLLAVTSAIAYAAPRAGSER